MYNCLSSKKAAWCGITDETVAVGFKRFLQSVTFNPAMFGSTSMSFERRGFEGRTRCGRVWIDQVAAPRIPLPNR